MPCGRSRGSTGLVERARRASRRDPARACNGTGRRRRSRPRPWRWSIPRSLPFDPDTSPERDTDEPVDEFHRRSAGVGDRDDHRAPQLPAAQGALTVGARGVRAGRVPVASQLHGDARRALVREEELRARQLDQGARAGDGLAEPASPGDVEEDVRGTPHDQRRAPRAGGAAARPRPSGGSPCARRSARGCGRARPRRAAGRGSRGAPRRRGAPDARSRRRARRGPSRGRVIDSSIGRSPPPSTPCTVGMKAGGGQPSWTSQLVRASVRIRSGCRAAKICAMAPPLSFATTSTRSTSSASRSWTSIARLARRTRRPRRRAPRVCPWQRMSGARQRRTSDTPSITPSQRLGVQEHAVDEERGRAVAPLDVRRSLPTTWGRDDDRTSEPPGIARDADGREGVCRVLSRARAMHAACTGAGDPSQLVVGTPRALRRCYARRAGIR